MRNPGTAVPMTDEYTKLSLAQHDPKAAEMLPAALDERGDATPREP
jgi:hypothetical protein